jgi:hypothetical protein
MAWQFNPPALTRSMLLEFSAAFQATLLPDKKVVGVIPDARNLNWYRGCLYAFNKPNRLALQECPREAGIPMEWP